MGELKLPEQSEGSRVNLREVFNTSKKEKYKPASISKRFVALFIDGLITTIATQVFSILVINKIFSDDLTRLGISFFMAFVVVPAAYWCYLPLKYGATPGKKMMGLKIVREDHSHNVEFKQLMLRESIGRSVSGFALGLGYLTALGRPDRATWHDKLSNTRVVEFK